MKTIKCWLILLFISSSVYVNAQWTAYSTMRGGKGTTIVTNSIRGHVELVSGKRMEGMVQLKVLNEDTVEVRIVPDGEKKKQKYLRAEVASFSGVMMLRDIKNDYKNPIKNFNPGSIFLEDGSEKKGKIAMGMREAVEHDGSKVYGPIRVKYANERDEVNVWKAEGSNIVYVIQNVAGDEKHYIKVGRQFIAVGNPKGRFSYFRNPNPTHVREGATGLAESASQRLTDEAAAALARAAAKESIKHDTQQGKDMATTIGNATVAANNAAAAVYDAADGDTDAIYFEEYFIVDNKKMTRSIIYKKNVDEVLNAILEGCGLEEKIVNKVGKMKELTEAMVFLEENICD